MMRSKIAHSLAISDIKLILQAAAETIRIL